MLFLIPLLFCSCTKVVTNSGDELTMSNWRAELDNKGVVTLTFESDNACFSFESSDGEKLVLEGLCELSKDVFVIHDVYTKTPYTFEYVVHFDSVDIMHGENTLSLDKMMQ